MELPLNLSALQSLTLTGGTTSIQFQCLKTKGQFHNLKTLAMDWYIFKEPSESPRDYPTVFPQPQDLTIAGLSFRPTSLTDSQTGEFSIDTVKSLRFVDWEEGFFDPLSEDFEYPNSVEESLKTTQELASLGAIFPFVEKLPLPDKRSKGDQPEVALYKTIEASFPRLEKLALTLDAGLETNDDGTYNWFEFVERPKQSNRQSRAQQMVDRATNLVDLLPAMRTIKS